MELDFTPESVRQLEVHCDDVEFALPGGMSEENIERLCRIWGSYLGEVVRRRRGGSWMRDANHQPALQLDKETLYPHQHVRRRLLEGKQHNLWTYLQNVLQES